MKCDFEPEDLFCGAVTVGERGQVVIPANARKRFNINPGDKIFVMGHPSGNGVMLIPIEAMKELLNSFMQGLTRAEQLLLAGNAGEGGSEG